MIAFYSRPAPYIEGVKRSTGSPAFSEEYLCRTAERMALGSWDWGHYSQRARGWLQQLIKHRPRNAFNSQQFRATDFPKPEGKRSQLVKRNIIRTSIRYGSCRFWYIPASWATFSLRIPFWRKNHLRLSRIRDLFTSFWYDGMDDAGGAGQEPLCCVTEWWKIETFPCIFTQLRRELATTEPNLEHSETKSVTKISATPPHACKMFCSTSTSHTVTPMLKKLQSPFRPPESASGS